MYDVYVARLGGTTYAVRSNGRVITKVPSGTDCSRLLKAAVDAVPSGGCTWTGKKSDLKEGSSFVEC